MELEILDVVTSTMDEARERTASGRIVIDDSGPRPFSGLLAWSQSGGRGRRGRSWHASSGDSLLVTYYYPRLLTDLRGVGAISLASGIAVAESLRSLFDAGDRDRIRLKWPNDVLIGDRKAAGILIEPVGVADNRWVALIGVGVNVRIERFPDELRDTATSLRLEGVSDCDIVRLAEEIGEAIAVWLRRTAVSGMDEIVARWRAMDGTSGRRYRADLGEGAVAGVAVGIDEAGCLLLRLDDGRTISVGSATSVEVE